LAGWLSLRWRWLIVDAENFYVLEDWVIDKVRGNGVTGWVGSCHGYQRQVIQGLEHVVKYVSSNTGLTGSFGTVDSGRRVVGKIRAGVIGDCKKEFETGIFALLETTIKLAKGSVESPAYDAKIEQVRFVFGVSLTVGCASPSVHQ